MAATLQADRLPVDDVPVAVIGRPDGRPVEGPPVRPEDVQPDGVKPIEGQLPLF